MRRDTAGRCSETYRYNCPEGASCNPPPPRDVLCPDATRLDVDDWRPEIGRIEDGTCVETSPPRCTPQGPCAEGPPRAVPCPDDGKLAFDRFEKTRTTRDASGRCWQETLVVCPNGLKCNPPPPPPEEIPCPDASKLDSDQYQLPKLRPPITRLPNGICVVPVSTPECPPEVRCNPPPPRTVPCPENPADLSEDYYKPK